MSDQNTPDLTVEQDSDDDLVKTLRSKLREEQAGRREAETRAGTLERKDVFRDLGIDTQTGPGKLFFEHYSGELDADAVKQAAQEYSIPVGQESTQTDEGQQTGDEGQQTPATGTQPPAQPHPDQQHHDELAAARAGAAGTGGLPDDKQRAQDKYEEAINSGRTNDEAMAGYFSERFNAAVEKRSRGA